VSCYPETATDLPSFREKADASLYRAKELGRNSVRLSNSRTFNRAGIISHGGTMKIADSITELIGNTPLVRVNALNRTVRRRYS
jgi:hypothetical protein